MDLSVERLKDNKNGKKWLFFHVGFFTDFLSIKDCSQVVFHTFQWAKIVLMIEQSVTPDRRLKQQLKYTQPMGDGKERVFVVRWHQTVSDQQCVSYICWHEDMHARN